MAKHFQIKGILGLIIVLCLLFVLFSQVSGEGHEKLNLNKETQHFIFYYKPVDEAVINKVSEELENNYSRITSDFKYCPKNKIIVEIYPELKELHGALGHPEAPDWAVGFAGNGKVQMVSPLNPGPQHTYDSLMKTVVHEFTHVVIEKMNSKIPIWLNEGIASFEADQMDDNQRNFIITKIKANHIPRIKDLEADWIGFAERGGYAWSYTIVEISVHDYGWEKVRKWVLNGGNIKSAFGISDNQFQEKWISFIKNKYLKQ